MRFFNAENIDEVLINSINKLMISKKIYKNTTDAQLLMSDFNLNQKCQDWYKKINTNLKKYINNSELSDLERYTKLNVKPLKSIKLKLFSNFIENFMKDNYTSTSPTIDNLSDYLNTYEFDDLYRFTVISQNLTQPNIESIIKIVGNVIYGNVTSEEGDITKIHDSNEYILKLKTGTKHKIKIKNSMCESKIKPNIYNGINVQFELPQPGKNPKIFLEMQIHTKESFNSENHKESHTLYKKYSRVVLYGWLKQLKMIHTPYIMKLFDTTEIFFNNLTVAQIIVGKEALEKQMNQNLIKSLTPLTENDFDADTLGPDKEKYPCKSTIKKLKIFNTNCTWSIALHHLVKYQKSYKSTVLGEVMVGFNVDALKKPRMLKTITVADTATKTKDGMDFGSGEIEKLMLKTITVADTATKTKDGMDFGSGEIEKAFNAQHIKPKYLAKNISTLITGGDNYNRLVNLKKLQQMILGEKPIPIYMLDLDMETKLSGLSVYDYVKTLLNPKENLLVVPIGNNDAHFILFNNNDDNKITVTFKNIANFNKIADLESKNDGENQEREKKLEETKTKLRELLGEKQEREKKLEETKTKLRELFSDKIIHKILFAGSFEFGFSRPINRDNNKPILSKGLSASLVGLLSTKFPKHDLSNLETLEQVLKECENFKESLIVGKPMTIGELQEKNISHKDWNSGKGKVNKRFFKILTDPEFITNFHDDLVCYLGDRSMVDGLIEIDTLETFETIFPSPQSSPSNGRVSKLAKMFSGGARRSRKNSRNRKSKRMRRTRSKSRKSRGSKKRSKHRGRSNRRYRK